MSELNLEDAAVDLLTCLDLHDARDATGLVQGVEFSIGGPSIVGLISPQRTSVEALTDLLSGFRTPANGEIRLDGRRIDGLAPAAICRAGLVRTFAHASLPLRTTIGQYLSLALALGRTTAGAGLAQQWRPFRPDDSGQIDEVLDFVQLAADPGEWVENLIDGQRARLELARALLQKARVIVADLLFAGLSGRERGQLAETLQTIHRYGIGILIADHDTLNLSRICDRILVVHEGRLIADGHPDEVGASEPVQVAFTGAGMI